MNTKNLFALGALSLLGTAATQAQKPNVVFVFADQWRGQDVGYMGNREVLTPHIDKLARQSLVLTHAVSNCPVSGAYRGCLLTGTYPLTNGVFYNDRPIAQNLTFLGDAYKDSGYNTAYIGKLHVDGHGRLDYIPPERHMGFDYWKALECTHDYNKSFYYEGDSPERLTWEGYDAIAQTRDAVRYIGERDPSKPFMMVLSWGPPHSPYDTAPEEYRALYAGISPTLRENVPEKDRQEALETYKGYYAHIAALDVCVGQLLAAVDKAGIAKNTIFVFTSDHGDMLHSHGHINKQKPWDESIRVPFVMRYPMELGDSQKVVDTPFGSPDIMPTLLSMSGIKIPRTVEGNDFSGYFKGKAEAPDTVSLIACYVPFHQWSYSMGGREYRGVRSQRYTYVRGLEGPWLLYDNAKDPFQLDNLVGDKSYEKVQKALDKVLDERLAKLGDKFECGHYYMAKWGYWFDPNDGDGPVSCDHPRKVQPPAAPAFSGGH